MNIHSFWKRKSEKSNLETLVKEFNEIQREFNEEFKRVMEGEVQESHSINIHYHPNKELFVIVDGDRFGSDDVSREMFEKLMEARNERNIEKIMDLIFSQEPTQQQYYTEQQEDTRVKATVEGVKILLDSGKFEVRNNSVYMKGIERSIPEDLVERFVESMKHITNETFQTLEKFWYWVCLNPRAEVADSLFGFLKKNFLRLNKNGFFYALRNVVSVGEDKAAVRYISERWLKVKGWKKNPANYDIWKAVDGKQDEFGITTNGSELHEDVTWEYMGNLQDLYENLHNLAENRYTDNHSHSFDIRIGKTVWMDPKKCSWSTVDCGESGLHFTMDQINYVGCGDTSVVMLINPMKVVGIGDTKGRCYEYLPISTIDTLSATAFLRSGDFNGEEIEDFEYAKEMENLEEKVKENFSIEAKKHSFNFAHVSSAEIATIVNLLTRVKNIQ